MSAPKKYLFLADDGWRYERRELLRHLKGRVDFDVATHGDDAYEKLKDDFDVIRLPVFPLKGRWAYTLVMFFAKELDTQLLRTVHRLRRKMASPARRLLLTVREWAGCLGLRRYSYSSALKFLYRRSRKYEALLKTYDALIYIPVNTVDKRIVYEAMNQGLEVVCYVYSWDNPMKDSEMIPDAHRYLVWNEETKRELCRLHGVDAERVSLVGPAQFDYLLNRPSPPVRPFEFPYVLYACSVATYDFHIEQEIQWVLKIREVMDRMAPDLTLVVRPYPFAGREHPYRTLENRPGIHLADFGRFEGWKLVIGKQDLDDRYNQMACAECFINFVSTIGLEVAFTETPIIQIAFNLPNEFAEWQDIARVLENDHLKYILDHDVPNVVRDVDAFEGALRNILSGEAEAYKGYSTELRKFAHPLGVDCYKEVFLRALT